jgi:hypothetical protein
MKLYHKKMKMLEMCRHMGVNTGRAMRGLAFGYGKNNILFEHAVIIRRFFPNFKKFIFLVAGR